MPSLLCLLRVLFGQPALPAERATGVRRQEQKVNLEIQERLERFQELPGDFDKLAELDFQQGTTACYDLFTTRMLPRLEFAAEFPWGV